MKKLLSAFPIVALLAAGCNSSQQAPNQIFVQPPVVQSTNPAPTSTAQNTNPTPIVKVSNAFEPSTVLDTSNWKVCAPSNINVTYKYPTDWVLYAPGHIDCSEVNPPDKQAKNGEVALLSVSDFATLYQTANQPGDKLAYQNITSDSNFTLIAQNSNYELFHSGFQDGGAIGETYVLVSPDHKDLIQFTNETHSFFPSGSRQTELDTIFENIVASAKFNP